MIDKRLTLRLCSRLFSPLNIDEACIHLSIWKVRQNIGWKEMYSKVKDIERLLRDVNGSKEVRGARNIKKLLEFPLVDNVFHCLNLYQIVKFDCSWNNLTTLPESIGNLTSLQVLICSDNHLTILPESIGEMTSLQYLDCSGNRLPESDITTIHTVL